MLPTSRAPRNGQGAQFTRCACSSPGPSCGLILAFLSSMDGWTEADFPLQCWEWLSPAREWRDEDVVAET